HVHEDFPFGPAFANLVAPDFRGEVDPALGRGLGPAAPLLVPCLAWEDDHDVGRVQEHRRRKDQVLVDAHGHPFQGLPHIRGPRPGMTPHFSRPTMPRAKARFMIALTLSAPKTCCVMPMLQTKTAVFAFPYISAKARISSLEQPDCFSRTSHSCLSKVSRRASN